MSVLVLGADGMLGRAVCRELGADCRAATIGDMDFSDTGAMPGRLAALMREGPRAVFNCAGWTDVDGAEAHEAEAEAVNGRAVGVLADACREAGALLAHVSTDYVFDGRGSEPYPTRATRLPINAYGRGKARGEELLERSGCRYLLLRTSWMYAPWGKNFVRTIARAALEKPVLRVVNDQRGRPTSAEHLARGALDLVERGEQGAWHVTDGGDCTWCEFAKEIVRLTGAPARVEPCTSAEYPRPAKRPAYSVLDISETERVLGPMRDWKENLADVVGRVKR